MPQATPYMDDNFLFSSGRTFSGEELPKFHGRRTRREQASTKDATTRSQSDAGGSKIKPWRSLWLQAAVHTEVAAAEAPAPGATRLRADLAKDAAAYATRPLNQSALLRPLWSSAVLSAPPRQ